MRNKIDKVNNMSVTKPEEVFEAIHTVMHLFRDIPQGLTHMEGKVLGFFSRHPGATLSALVSHSGRDKGQLARLIASLREQGMLEAQADEKDRRNTCLRLTAAGAALQESLHRQSRHLSVLAVRGISPEEQAVLLDLLARVRGNLDAEE